MSWNLDQSKPIYLQLLDEIKQRILTGAYAPGSYIPSVRDLAAEAQVNPNTMQRALMELERQGFLETVRGSGRIVIEDAGRIASARVYAAQEELFACLRKLRQMGISKEELAGMIAAFEQQAAAAPPDGSGNAMGAPAVAGTATGISGMPAPCTAMTGAPAGAGTATGVSGMPAPGTVATDAAGAQTGATGQTGYVNNPAIIYRG